MSYSVLPNGGRHWRFVLRRAIQQEVRVKRKPFKRFHDNRKSIPQRFKTSIRKMVTKSTGWYRLSFKIVLRNGNSRVVLRFTRWKVGIWSFVLRSALQTEIRVKHKPFEGAIWQLYCTPLPFLVQCRWTHVVGNSLWRNHLVEKGSQLPPCPPGSAPATSPQVELVLSSNIHWLHSLEISSAWALSSNYTP